MGERDKHLFDGILYIHTAGRKVRDFNDMSDTMLEDIRVHYPDYTMPPPSLMAGKI